MVRVWAILFGIVMIFVGVIGYGVVPQLIENNLLLGIFEVDAVHNLIHVVTGVVAIMAATSFKASRLFFIVFGFVYAAVALVGFWNNGDLFIMHVNMADNYLHVAIAIFALLVGFGAKRSR